MMNLPRVKWGEDGFAFESGWAFAHCINQVTGELLYSQDVWVVVGTGLPSGAFLDPPPQSEDSKAIVRRNDVWVLVEDFRGTPTYNKSDCSYKEVDYLGSIDENYTTLVPSSSKDVWVGDHWEPHKKQFEEVMHERSTKYDSDLFYLQRVWLSAAVMDGQEEMGRKQEVEQEIEELKIEYLTDVALIKQEYGVI